MIREEALLGKFTMNRPWRASSGTRRDSAPREHRQRDLVPSHVRQSASSAPPMRKIVIVEGSGIEASATQLVMALVSSVTAPLRAKALPSKMVAPVFIVMLGSGRICPWKAVPVSSVAELPTCQNTVHPGIPSPLLIVTTDEPGAVVSVLPIWKTNSASGSPRL